LEIRPKRTKINLEGKKKVLPDGKRGFRGPLKIQGPEKEPSSEGEGARAKTSSKEEKSLLL